MTRGQEMLNLLKKYGDQPILVTGHRDPDGDCIGSIVALCLVLKNMGYNAYAVNRDIVPYRYAFLDPHKILKNQEEVADVPFSAAFVLDSSNINRLGYDLRQKFPDIKEIINIDHHVSNDRFGNINIINPSCSAVCELLYLMFMEIDAPIDQVTANALYTGITTDTGSFQYESTTADTLRIGADLIDLGADINLIRENVWENEPLNRIKVLSNVLDNLKITQDRSIAWIKISHEQLDHYKLDNGDLESFVDYPRTIQGVEVAVFFKEIQKGFTKISIRTKSVIDANKLAQLFDGGGHKRAAGCKLTGNLDEIEQRVIETFKKELEKKVV